MSLFKDSTVIKLFCGEMILKGTEEMIVRGGKIRRVRWVGNNFPAKLKEIV